jgi:hypothetical protein
MAFLLVEAADVTQLQERLRETISGIKPQQGERAPGGGTSSGPSPESASGRRSWEVAAGLLPGCRLGQAAGRAKEAAGKLLERQRDNVVLVASLAALQAMMGKTTVGSVDIG